MEPPVSPWSKFTPSPRRPNNQNRFSVLEQGALIVGGSVGPSLAGFGVLNALPDPTLELHDGNGALIASNNDWKGTQQAAIEATGIPPSNDKESAILPTLAPGNYTAIMRGVGNTTGVGLVEVYNLQ